jgi:hypothetical protein
MYVCMYVYSGRVFTCVCNRGSRPWEGRIICIAVVGLIGVRHIEVVVLIGVRHIEREGLIGVSDIEVVGLHKV